MNCESIIAALYVRPVERLELGFGKRMGRGPLHQRVRPGLEPRIFFDDADRLDAVEKVIALQERRVAGIDQRKFRAVEERSRALSRAPSPNARSPPAFRDRPVVALFVAA